MQINFNSQNIISFSSKKKEIRDADDIQRRAKLVFPYFSTTYADSFYSSNNDSNYLIKIKKLKNKLLSIRYSVMCEEFFDSVPHRLILKKVKKHKLGNCGEVSKLVLAGLYANEIYDSDRYSLCLKTKFINKKTNFTEYEPKTLLDHAFVISTMKKNSKINKDKVVIDGWYGYTGDLSGAIENFKKIYSSDYLANVENEHKEKFIKVKANQQKEVNWNDYEIKTTFHFKKIDDFSLSKKKLLGNTIKEEYPDLVIKMPQSSQSNF